MLKTFAEYATSTAAIAAAAFFAGVFLSQKIKDFITGVPADLRSTMGAVETKAAADLKSAQAEVLSKLPQAVKKVEAPVAPAVVPAPAPAAPAAPHQ